MKSFAAAVAVLFFAVVAAGESINTKQHIALARGEWLAVDAVPVKRELHTFVVALRHRASFAEIERAFTAIATPGQRQYGQHLTAEAWRQRFSLPKPTHDKLRQFFLAKGAIAVDGVAAGDVMHVTMPAAKIDALFDVDLRCFRRRAASSSTLPRRCLLRSPRAHSVPVAIADLVELVHGLSDFPPPARLRINDRLMHAGAEAADQAQAQPNGDREPGRAAADADGNGPKFLLLASRATSNPEQGTVLEFSPRCRDGSVARQLPACPTAGQVDSVQVNVYNAYEASPPFRHQITVPVAAEHCTVQQPAAGQPSIVCKVQFSPPYYVPVRVDMQSHFADDNSVSATTSAPFPTVRTPPVLPDTLYRLYDMPSSPRVITNASQCVVEFESQFYNDADLQTFFKVAGLEAPLHPVKVIGPNPAPAGGEARRVTFEE